MAAASEVLSVRFFHAAPRTVSNFLLPLLPRSIIIYVYRRIKKMRAERQEGRKYPLLPPTRVNVIFLIHVETREVHSGLEHGKRIFLARICTTY